MAITRHNRAWAVMLSLAEYEALVKRAGDPPQRRQDYFDEMLAKMQNSGTDKAVAELFGEKPKRNSSPQNMSRR